MHPSSPSSFSWYDKVKHGPRFLRCFEEDGFLAGTRNLNDAGAVDVARALNDPENRTTGLALEACESLTYVGVTVLAETITTHAYLDYFCLHGFEASHPENDRAAIAIAKMLRANPKLSHLDLSNSTWDDSGIALIMGALEENTKLRSLRLNNTAFGSCSCLHFSANRNAGGLSKIEGDSSDDCFTCDEHVGFGRISHVDYNAGGLALAKVLEINRQLEKLEIEGATVTNTAAVALRESLSSNKTLKTLNISEISIEREGWEDLMQGLGSNQAIESLVLDEFDLIPWFDPSFPSEDEKGEEKVCRGGTRPLAEMLMGNKSIQSLSLVSSSLDDDSAPILASGLVANRTLKSLDLSCTTRSLCALGATGATAIARALASSNSPLETLKLENNAICSVGVKALVEPLQNSNGAALRSLDLSGNLFVANTDTMEAFAELLRTSSQLHSLTIDHSNLTDDSIKILVETGLTTEKCQLQELRLNENQFSDDGLSFLSEALKSKNTSLRTLAVVNMHFGKKGCAAFAEALKVNTTLQTLQMCVNQTASNKHNRKRLLRGLDCNTTLLSFYSLPYLGRYPWQAHCDRNAALYLSSALLTNNANRLPLSAIPLVCDLLQHKVLLCDRAALVRCILFRALRNGSFSSTSALWSQLRRCLVGQDAPSKTEAQHGSGRRDRKRKAHV